MNKLNLPKLLLAILVIAMFSGIGVAIAYRSVLFIILFTILGFATMGYGIAIKQRN